MAHYVYILASRPHGAIYIGAAADLRQRLSQHCNSRARSHTNRYNIKTLVYFELHAGLRDALQREKRLKRWRRAWKDQLIMECNPDWQDVSSEIPL